MNCKLAEARGNVEAYRVALGNQNSLGCNLCSVPFQVNDYSGHNSLMWELEDVACE